ncbi:MAG: lysoplasmalogenase [Chitinophagales bacterium]|nr:lysoplasmalogenase [Chitinophagales bacterium]
MAGESLSQSSGSHLFIWLLKPLLMPLLMLWYYLQTKAEHTFDKILLVSLFFSWWGDNFLMPGIFKTDINFLLGLASFLIAHLLYIYAFTITPQQNPRILRSKPYLVLLLVPLVVGLLYYLTIQNTDAFNEMKIPVMVYATVIMFMVLAAINCFGNVPAESFKWVLIGAVMFMISDSLIALNKFSPLFENVKWFPRFGIMTLYAVGQFLIAKGCVLQYDRRN